MVNYEEFKENFKEDVTRELAKNGIEDVEITIQPNEKFNQSYNALTVRPDGYTLGVSLLEQKRMHRCLRRFLIRIWRTWPLFIGLSWEVMIAVSRLS